MLSVFVSYSQLIRFVRFDKESVNCGIPVLISPEVGILGADQKELHLW